MYCFPAPPWQRRQEKYVSACSVPLHPPGVHDACASTISCKRDKYKECHRQSAGGMLPGSQCAPGWAESSPLIAFPKQEWTVVHPQLFPVFACHSFARTADIIDGTRPSKCSCRLGPAGEVATFGSVRQAHTAAGACVIVTCGQDNFAAFLRYVPCIVFRLAQSLP